MELVEGRHLRPYYDESPPVVAAALDPRCTALLVSNRDGGVTSYNLRTGRRSSRFVGHVGSVSVATCDDQLVATGAYDGTCRVWSWNGNPVTVFDLREGPVQAIALDRENARIWVGTLAGSIVCFSLNSLTQAATCADHQASIRSLNLSEDRRLLISGDNSGKVIVWNLRAQGRILRRITERGTLYRCIFDADGSILATTSAGVARYDIQSGHRLALYEGEDIRWFCILDDGRLCSLGLTGALRVFDVESGVCVGHVQIDDPRPHRVVLSLGPNRIVTGSGDGLLRFFDYELRPVAELHHLRRGVLWMTAAAGCQPGWFFTDRPEMLDIGEISDSAGEPWPPSDRRRERHFAVFNSATHVMHLVTDQTTDRVSPLGAERQLSTPALGLPRLGFLSDDSRTDRSGQ
jgi:hypothetical protein